MRSPPLLRLPTRFALAGLLAFAVVAARADLSISAPGRMPTGHTVTAEQLWQEFDRGFPPGVWISPLQNADYEIVSARWLRNTFLPSLREQMRGMWRQRLPEENSAANCNGFALVCRLMLGLSAMSAHAHAPATATVIVEQKNAFGGLDATHENHCVAFVLTDEGPWIVEPQSAAWTPLSRYPNRATIKLVSVH